MFNKTHLLKDLRQLKIKKRNLSSRSKTAIDKEYLVLLNKNLDRKELDNLWYLPNLTNENLYSLFNRTNRNIRKKLSRGNKKIL